jgi:predicted O-linked N-acetylglucosamine transferase (SPINDLY family)
VAPLRASGGDGNVTLVRDLRDYVEVSVRLGRAANRARLERQRGALREGRWSSPMFDTRRCALP